MLWPFVQLRIALDIAGWGRRQWPFRTTLGQITGFGGETRAESGASWWGWYRWVAQRYLTPLSITFAFVSSHNHFALDRGGRAYNHSAPVLKFLEGTAETDHLALMGALNSSTACFWLKQQSQPKGGAAETSWSRTYEFTGTTLEDFPLPFTLPLEQNQLDQLACELTAHEPSAAIVDKVPITNLLAEARAASDKIRARMIFVQEELDWEDIPAVWTRQGRLDLQRN